jgi:beta-aspartyl-peptidase (threonine type)
MRVWVHGGVSDTEGKTHPPLAHAVEHGSAAATAIDAVETATRALEETPELNAGYGCVLNIDGDIELDAGLVDGRSGRAAGVANVTVRHPITLARRVLEETPHVLVAGRGAMALARDMERLHETTPKQHERWQRARRGELAPATFGRPHRVDTVGAVARADDGALAAASSTGGVFGKLPGRVGDAPVLGAGVYASRRAAVVGTGVGELFLETLASLRTGLLIESGVHPRDACARVVEDLGRRRRVAAGLLAADASGRAGGAFRGGSWAVEGPEGPLSLVRMD